MTLAIIIILGSVVIALDLLINKECKEAIRLTKIKNSLEEKAKK
ncbi:hypothetical protein [Lactobacillus mulieris]|nr:hypothetical protein [Lactobacillus mulieris]